MPPPLTLLLLLLALLMLLGDLQMLISTAYVGGG